jgi:hypothetical protein
MAAISELRTQIWNSRVENAENRHFVPQGKLESILTPANVREAIRQSGIEPHELTRTTEIILRRAPRIFAILLRIHEVRQILTFIANDQLQREGLDQCLPFRPGALDFLPSEIAEQFCETQWEFAAPVFSCQFQHRILDPSTIMPFTSSKFIGKGAFGHVHEVELHPQHHELHHLSKDTVSLCLSKLGEPLTDFHC